MISGNTNAQLRIVIVGHVDHGKSTLVGRLLYETGTLPEGKLDQLKAAAVRRGVPFEWANLTDALQAERDQNVTIETAHICFRTPNRHYVLIDAPGHKEFLKNMVTGATQADAALLVINANEGVQEQSRRHGYLLHLLGIRQIAVLINQMDLRDYSQIRFTQIEDQYRAFLEEIGLQPMAIIPISAKQGDNLAQPSPRMAWWHGPTVLQALEQFSLAGPAQQRPLRFPVQDVYRLDHRRLVVGRVESGTLKLGDLLLFSPGHKMSAVKTIEVWNAPARQYASAGESIAITLTDPIYVRRGAVAALVTMPPLELTRCKARLFWLGHRPFRPGITYKLKLTTQELECSIDQLEKVIDGASLQPLARNDGENCVHRHEVADVYLRTRQPLVFDPHTEIAEMGRFVIVDENELCGGGIILDDNYARRTADSIHKSRNIFWTQGKVSAEQRARRQGHRGCVVWLTGLSGSGKSSIATELERELFERGQNTYVLDGDNIRHGLCADLGFSHEDRKENIRRIGQVAALFADAGVICITAFISPYRSDRDLVRQAIPPGEFLEVYLNAPLSVCEQRDPKGLYAKARANQIKEFTGISAPYEPPLQPELELDTSTMSIAESVARVLAMLEPVTSFQALPDQKDLLASQILPGKARDEAASPSRQDESKARLGTVATHNLASQ